MARSITRFSSPLSLGAVVLVAGLSCTLPPSRPPEPRAKLLKDDELSVCITRVGQYPRHIVVSAETVPVRIYVDPGLADVRQIKAYTLWRTGIDGRSWEKVATVPPGAPPILLAPEEGLVGLRGSITNVDDSEFFAPAPGEEPALWLRVDRTPPGIVWIEPPPGAPIRGLKSVRLRWSTSDAHFGAVPLRLEWSADGGRGWKPITTLPAERGEQRFTWRLPAELATDVLVRIVATDLTGQESSSQLALSYPLPVDAHSVPAGPPAPAAAAGAAALASAGKETPGPVPAAGPEPSQDPIPASAPEREIPEPPAAAPSTEFALEPIGPEVVRGGAEVLLSWTYGGEAVGGMAAIEWSADGGATWSPQGAAPLAAGRAVWTAPAVTGKGYRVRLRAALPDGSLVEAVSPNQIAVDADPPSVRLGNLPEVLGARAAVSASVSDAGGAGVESIEVSLRTPGAAEWRRLEGVKSDPARGVVEIDLSGEPEGVHELFVQAVDRAGNSSVAPPTGAGSEESAFPAFTRFRLDRTPPRLSCRPTPLGWVAGFRAEAQVEIDWTDAVPPLVIEDRRPDGSWLEMGRWTSISPGQERFSFDVPPLVKEHAVRFVVADAAGNRAEAIVGPKPVEPPLRLVTFTEGKTYPARGAEKVRWTLHPLAAEAEASFRVSVAHLVGGGETSRGRAGEWQVLYPSLPAGGECYWDMPEGDREEHRIRARLHRVPGGELVGEDVSPPFSIGGTDGVAPTVVRISDESRFYSDQARVRADQYAAAATAGGAAGSTELEKLSADARAAFEKAIELDPRNYHATYGLAQFLNRTDPAGNAAAVSKWLRRTIEIKPDHLWALNDVGALSIREGNFPEAESALRRCAAIEPSPIVLFNLGLALFYGGSTVEARKSFEDALKAKGKGSVPEGEAYYYIARSYFQEGERDRALALFREKEKAMPPELRQDLARLLGA